MLKKSLCLVLGFMCIGDMFGSPKELPLGSFNSSGENDLSLCDDSNMYRKETASTRKSLSDVNTQQKKKSRIEECKTNTSKNESKIITIDNDGQKNSDINNVTEHPIDEKEAISSDSNIEPASGSGSNSNESSFSEDTDVTKNSINNNINEKSPVGASLVDEEKLPKDESNSEITDYSEDDIDEHQIEQMMSASQVSVCCIPMIKDKEERNKLINEINTTLKQYIEKKENNLKESYGFLFTLMCMCSFYEQGNKPVLDPNINVKPILLNNLGIEESKIGENSFAQGKLIYNWFVNNEDDTICDFLGETKYPNHPIVLNK